MADTDPLLFAGMIFETAVIAIISLMLVLIFLRYLEKKHQLTLFLLLIFINFTMAVVFSWLSKLLVLYSGLGYLYNASAPDPGTLISWLLLRIIDFRISFVFVTLSTYFAYVLKVNVFEKGYVKAQRIAVIIYGFFTGFYSLVIYQRGNTFLDVLAFLFVFIFLSIIYIPFMVKTLNSYKSVEDPIYKKAFLSLAIMCISFMSVFLSFLIDRIFILMGSPGFTVFYFLAWILGILGIISAYFGFIKPRSG